MLTVYGNILAWSQLSMMVLSAKRYDQESRCLVNLTLLVCSSALLSQHRFQSSGTSTTFLTLKNRDSFRKNWLSDPSTYPLLVALGSAVALCAGVGFSCLAYSPDVRIAADKKRATIRNWGLN